MGLDDFNETREYTYRMGYGVGFVAGAEAMRALLANMLTAQERIAAGCSGEVATTMQHLIKAQRELIANFASQCAAFKQDDLKKWRRDDCSKRLDPPAFIAMEMQ